MTACVVLQLILLSCQSVLGFQQNIVVVNRNELLHQRRFAHPLNKPRSFPAALAGVGTCNVDATSTTWMYKDCYTKRHQQRRTYTVRLYQSLSNDMDSSSSSSSDGTDSEATTSDDSRMKPMRRRLLFFRRSFKKGPDDGLTVRQRLTKMGFSALLSYGFISNVNGVINVAVAWFIYGKRSGLSPLVPGQWKGFLGVFAGLYVLSNFMRPARIALAIALQPYLDRFILFVQTKFGFSRSLAIFAAVFLLNIVGTTTILVGGVSIASIAAGIPLLPARS